MKTQKYLALFEYIGTKYNGIQPMAGLNKPKVIIKGKELYTIQEVLEVSLN